MQATPFALQLAEPVAQALDALHLALNVRSSFEPAGSTRRFSLAMTDVGEMYFLPVLMDLLDQHAPGVTLNVVSVATESLKDDMASGRIDLALGLLSPERFAQRVTQPYGLTTRALPLAVQSSAIHQFWHARMQRDPGHQWLRALIVQGFGADADRPVPWQTPTASNH